MRAYSPFTPAAIKYLLVGILFIVTGCTPRETAPSDSSEREVYITVLRYLKNLPKVDGSTAVYPSLIMVHPEGGPAPGDKVEHYLPQRSPALREAVAALPAFTFCTGEPIGHCDKAHNYVHITLSAVDFQAAGRAMVWVLITYLSPRGGSISYDRVFVGRGPEGWQVEEFVHGGVEDFGVM